jgi:hypothetical protein
VDTGYLKDSADNTTGDKAGTSAGWLDEDTGTTHFGLSLVWNGVVFDGYVDEVLLGNFGGFGNSGRHVCTLGDTDTDTVFAVTHHNKRAETEAAATLYNAGHAVDVYDTLVKWLVFGGNFRATTARATTATLWATIVAALALWATVLLRAISTGSTSWLTLRCSSGCSGCGCILGHN